MDWTPTKERQPAHDETVFIKRIKDNEPQYGVASMRIFKEKQEWWGVYDNGPDPWYIDEPDYWKPVEVK